MEVGSGFQAGIPGRAGSSPGASPPPAAGRPRPLPKVSRITSPTSPESHHWVLMGLQRRERLSEEFRDRQALTRKRRMSTGSAGLLRRRQGVVACPFVPEAPALRDRAEPDKAVPLDGEAIQLPLAFEHPFQPVRSALTAGSRRAPSSRRRSWTRGRGRSPPERHGPRRRSRPRRACGGRRPANRRTGIAPGARSRRGG
jgi:hypothetical protein